MYTIKWLEKTVLVHKQSIEAKLIHQSVCKYPGKITPFKQLSGTSPEGKPLDTLHTHIMDTETKLAFAYFTSAKKVDGKMTTRLGDVKVNGQISRLRDPKTNEYYKDEGGDYISDRVSGGQRIGLYKDPKKYEDISMIEVQIKYQPGCDMYEDDLLKIAKETGILKKQPIIIKKDYNAATNDAQTQNETEPVSDINSVQKYLDNKKY